MKRILLIILTVVTIIGVTPIPVYATTANLTVAADGSDSSTYESYQAPYGVVAGTFANLNSDDGDASVLNVNSSGGGSYDYKSYTMSAFAGLYSSINSVTLSVKSRSFTGATNALLTPYVRISGTRYYASSATFLNHLAYATVSYTWTTNPATGLAWTLAQINAAEYGFQMWAAAGGQGYITTYMFVTVDYVAITVPSVTTSAVTGVGYGPNHHATLNGDITSTGGATVDFRGFCYGTTSNTTTPASTQSPPAGYTSNWTEGGSFGTGTFSHQLTGLAAGTTYYYRAYAHNSQGWAYGTQLSFTTLSSPDITTIAATNIAATSARLNALVISNGGQLADVRFLYSTVSGNCTDAAVCATATCNTTSYNATTPFVNNTYSTGNTPYVDISGLVPSKTYYFCSQIQNDYTCNCGGQLSFTTLSGVSVPTSLKGIAGPTTLSLFWVKGVGSTNTLLRYKIGGFPSDVADGVQAYFDSQTSVLVPSLTTGTTYYFIAWGESGGVYSTANTTVILTTLPATAADPNLPAPTTPTQWFQSPDYTNVANLPWYGIVNWWADTAQIPRSTLWFIGAMMCAMAGGVLVYGWSRKIIIAVLVVIVLIGLFAMMKLLSLWIIVPFLIVAIASIVIGERI